MFLAEFMKNSFNEIDVSVAAIMAEPLDNLLSDDVIPLTSDKKIEEKQKTEEKPADDKLANNLPLVGSPVKEVEKKVDAKEAKSLDSPFDSSLYDDKDEADDDDDDDDDEYGYDSYEEDEGEPVQEPKKVEENVALPPVKEDFKPAEISKEEFDDETMEDEHALTKDYEAKVAHHQADNFAAEQAVSV